MLRRLSVQLMAGITLAIVLMLSTNLWMLWRKQQQELMSEMHGKAQMVAQQLIATRLFIARSQTQINQNSLGHFEFKGLNPAAVGRGIGAIYQDLTGVTIKQTRFQVRRPENAPDAFEWEALTRFAEDPGLKEYYKQVEWNGEPFFRFSMPLRTEQECLACHGEPAGTTDVAGYLKEGLREGQLGGAISVAVPVAAAMARLQSNMLQQVWVIVGVAFISLLVIYLLSRILVTAPLERLAALAVRIGSGRLEVKPGELEPLRRSQELDTLANSIRSMATSLQDLYTGLESKVAERTRELEQANRLQSQFLATVSHELRTPLTSILAFSELLLKRAFGKQREYLEDVLDSGRHLLEMVNNLLDLSRLEAGRVRLFTDLVDLPELMFTVERSLRPLAEKKQITLTVESSGALPPVLVDALRVQQVLMNLVGNAIKFTPEGGKVTLSATAGEYLMVTVSDTGPGVPEGERMRVFETFRRVEAPGLRHPGSGLGLALARNLVELHGGRIWVEGAPNGGSLFRFTLPIPSDSPAEVARDYGTDQADPGRRRRYQDRQSGG